MSLAPQLGIVGRTGAGKTSLLSALLRLVDTVSGSIWIDGANVKSLRLQDLRSNISVISQTPALVEGSLRYNLDIQNQFSDSELYEVLTAVQLRNKLGSEGLQTWVGNIYGQIFSSEFRILTKPVFTTWYLPDKYRFLPPFFGYDMTMVLAVLN